MAAEIPVYTKPDDSLKLYEVKNEWDGTGKPVLYQNPQAAYMRTSCEKVFQVAPSVFTAGDIKSQQQMQIRVTPRLLSGYFEFVTLQLTFTNTDAVNSVTLAPVPYIFSVTGNAISTAFNSSGAPVNNISADALYFQLQHVTPAQLANLTAFNQMNLTTTAYASPTAIAASGTAIYNVPLPMSPIIGLNSQTLDGDVIMTINWNNNGAVVAGTGTASLTNVTLVVTTHENKRVDPERTSQINSDVYIKNYCNWAPLNYSNIALAAGSRAQIALVGLAPCYAGGMLVLIRANKTGSGAYTFTSLAGTNGSEFQTAIDLQDNKGTSVLGGAPISGGFSRATIQMLESRGTMSNVVAAYWVYFSANPAGFIANGDASQGVLKLGQNMSLFLTPAAGSNFAGGNYMVDVYVFQQQKIRQISGKVEVLSSL